jgi:UDP-N-acetylglucosamine 4,6-dehydratase
MKVPFGFKYSSDSNEEWETVDTLRQLIKEHVDNDFKAT